MAAKFDLIKTLYDNLRISPRSFGFAGEVYARFYYFEEKHKEIIEKYIFVYQATFINRKAIYYTTSIEDALYILEMTTNDYMTICQSKINLEYKRYVLFTIVEYAMHMICKLLNV